MEINKSLVNLLQYGDIAVINDGTYDELVTVLKSAFGRISLPQKESHSEALKSAITKANDINNGR